MDTIDEANAVPIVSKPANLYLYSKRWRKSQNSCAGVKINPINIKNNNEFELLDYVSSVNISCGFHAGDPVTIKEALLKAKEKGKVRIEGKDYVVCDGDVILFRFNV